MTTLHVSAEEIEAALRRLRGPVTRDEAIVMAAAQAAVDAMRGSPISVVGPLPPRCPVCSSIGAHTFLGDDKYPDHHWP